MISRSQLNIQPTERKDFPTIGTVIALPRRQPARRDPVLFVQIRLLAAAVAVLFAAASPASAEPESGTADPGEADRERLREIEQEVQILQRKLEVQEEDAAKAKTKTPIVGAGPDGFFLKSPDNKSFVLKLRGYTQFDSRWFVEGEDAGDDSFAFRRVRPLLEGTAFESIDFRVMPDFAGSSFTLYDAYVNFHYIQQAQLEVGKFKPPVGLERLQSATATMFIERAFPTQLVPSRDLGAMLQGEFANGFFTYQVGGFNGVRDGGTQDIDTDDGKDVAARIFLHPFRPLENDWLDGFGVGVGGTWGRVDEQTPATYKLVPESGNFFAYRPAEGGFQAVSAEGDRFRWSPQAYWYVGPLGVLGEYVLSEQELRRDFTAATGTPSEKADLRNTAWQVAASFVLTGEDASYKGVVPAQPFDPFKGTWGAFELAARFNELDFDNDTFPVFANPALSVDRAQGWTAGLNWYLNRWIRVMFDYDHTWFNGGRPNSEDRPAEGTILTRLQLSF
jgi:phosphate-selective porin OprO/OprP